MGTGICRVWRHHLGVLYQSRAATLEGYRLDSVQRFPLVSRPMLAVFGVFVRLFSLFRHRTWIARTA